MRDLKDIRADFNQVDAEISRLYAKRMELAKEVAALKLSEGKQIYDPKREKEVIETRKAAFPDADEVFLEGLERLYTLLMQLSKEEQQRIFKGVEQLSLEDEGTDQAKGVLDKNVAAKENGSETEDFKEIEVYKETNEIKEISVYTDGACSGNPGPGGYGCVLMFADEDGMMYQKEMSQGYAKTTNNRMEILAVIAALEMIKKPCRITLYSDSQYVVKAFNEGWLQKWQRFDWHKDQKKKEPVKNSDLWKRLLRAASPHEITYVWVKGHAENEWNNRCDQLAVSASMDSANWKTDEGYTEL